MPGHAHSGAVDLPHAAPDRNSTQTPHRSTGRPGAARSGMAAGLDAQVRRRSRRMRTRSFGVTLLAGSCSWALPCVYPAKSAPLVTVVAIAESALDTSLCSDSTRTAAAHATPRFQSPRPTCLQHSISRGSTYLPAPHNPPLGIDYTKHKGLA
jgi:hypothetical protein